MSVAAALWRITCGCYIHAAYSWGMKSDNDYRNTSPRGARLHVDQWDAPEKIIDWSKTKNLQPHAVPVPSIAAELIESIKPNKYGWFLPSAKDPSQPVSHGTLYSFVWRPRDGHDSLCN